MQFFSYLDFSQWRKNKPLHFFICYGVLFVEALFFCFGSAFIPAKGMLKGVNNFMIHTNAWGISKSFSNFMHGWNYSKSLGIAQNMTLTQAIKQKN